MKNRIIQVAAQAMNERGTKFTVDTVAQRLGISKKTLYQYVASKEELIQLIVDTALGDVHSQQTEILHSNKTFVEKLTSVLTSQPHIFGPINDWIFDDIKNSCPSAWDDIEEFRRSRAQVIIDLLEEGKASGEIRSINSQIAAQALRGALREMIDYGFLSSANLTLKDAMSGCVDLLIHGMLKSGGENLE
jgi:AcrR family transcriptional regulator